MSSSGIKQQVKVTGKQDPISLAYIVQVCDITIEKRKDSIAAQPHNEN
jgi:hypothetical protein